MIPGYPSYMHQPPPAAAVQQSHIKPEMASFVVPPPGYPSVVGPQHHFHTYAPAAAMWSQPPPIKMPTAANPQHQVSAPRFLRDIRYVGDAPKNSITGLGLYFLYFLSLFSLVLIVKN